MDHVLLSYLYNTNDKYSITQWPHAGRNELGPYETYNPLAALSASSAAAISPFIQRAPKMPTSPAIMRVGTQVTSSAKLKSPPARLLAKCPPCVGSKALARMPISEGAKASPSRCASSNDTATAVARKIAGTTS